MFPGDSELSELAAQIISLSGDPGHGHQLLTLLAKNSTVINVSPSPLLGVLNFAEQSLASLYVLWCWRDRENGIQGRGQNMDWMQAAARFFRECDASHLGLVKEKFLAVARGLKEQAMAMGKARLAIRPLYHAIQKFAPSQDHLTPLHAEFFQICLLAKNYAAAKELLFREVYEMDPSQTLLSPTAFLLYCYYGGRLCIGLKCHARALQLFYLALVAPTLASNAIALMIYKYFVLLSLLETGKVPELPRYTSITILKLSRSPFVAPYMRLAEAYEGECVCASTGVAMEAIGLVIHLDSNDKDVEQVVRECEQNFVEDNCMGLVKQVVASLVPRDIKACTSKFMTRSVSDIAAESRIPNQEEAERVLLRLVQQKQIAVQISCRQGMVKFLDDDDLHDTAETAVKLDAMIQEVIQLGERMQDVQDQIELDPEYRSRVLQAKQHSKLDC